MYLCSASVAAAAGARALVKVTSEIILVHYVEVLTVYNSVRIFLNICNIYTLVVVIICLFECTYLKNFWVVLKLFL